MEAEVAYLQANFLTAHTQEATLQSSLDEERRVSEERLAQLETIVDDSVHSTRAELM